MPQQSSALDFEKLREFELRMHQEGVAAFAAGPSPWEHWDDAGTLGTWQKLEQHLPHHPGRHTPHRTTGQRLLGGLTRLLVLVLLVGIGGVYFSSVTREPVVLSGVRPAPIMVAQTPVTSALPADSPADELDTLPPPSAGDDSRQAIEVAADTRPAGAVDRVATGQADGPAAAVAVPETVTGEHLTASDTPLDPEDSTPRQAPTTGTPTPANLPVAETTAPQAAPAGPESSAGDSGPGAEIALLTATPVPPASGLDRATGDPETDTPPLADDDQIIGDWVVNLASYTRESTARRMLEKFRDKGVDAELVTVTVHDRNMVRLRARGYRSANEARDWVPLLEERLGLKGVWISRR